MASRRADDRQQAEEEQAKALLSQMQQNADDSPSPSNLKADKKAEEDRKRQEHEQAEAKRKAEWEARQRAKEEAEQAAWENAVAMSDDEVMAASMKRVGDDSERLTRRNMKQCVTEYIQTLCLEDVAFARNVMHPRKNMVNCFRYMITNGKRRGMHIVPLVGTRSVLRQLSTTPPVSALAAKRRSHSSAEEGVDVFLTAKRFKCCKRQKMASCCCGS